MSTLDWEREFLALDDKFPTIQKLKTLYEDFNDSYITNLSEAENELNEIMKTYSTSDIKLFRDFAEILMRHKDTIINSFTYIKGEKLYKNKEVVRRLSNGPLESFNNIPSHYRSQSKGIKNFIFTRNRILWSVRKVTPIKAKPFTKEEVHNPGKKRGPYNKNK